jgi:vacuolar-type H+-ATPase subunit E/Vma4
MDESALIESIERDASREADKIDAQTRKIVEDRGKAAEQQIQLIKQQADEKLKGQVAAIERNTASSIAVEIHRTGLRIRETITREVIHKAEQRLQSLMDKKEYSGILQDWIVEGAIGLNAEKAEVNASEAEMKLINRDLLTKAEAKVRDITGRKVNLVKSRRDPLSAQGVVLTTENGRISFNNQAPARFLRYQSEIRKLIMSELFE